MSAFAIELVARTKAEWEFFGKDEGSSDHKVSGTAKETVDPYASRVGDYWLSISEGDYKSLVHSFAKTKGKLDGTIRDLPWSAAFISYCMQVAGAGTEFPYAPGHATWIVQAIKAKEKGKLSAPLVGYKPGEIVVALGDLVGNTREAGVTYANAVAKGWFISHTDIVVEIDTAGGKFHTIGGNVGQSVSRKTFALKPSGEIASGSGLLVHIQNQITGVTKISAAAATKTVAVG
jgi:hypothetical protein